MSSSTTDTLIEVTMPQMGVSMAEGTVVSWHKRVGDWVGAEETICEISTDKIDSEVPAPAPGRVSEILVEAEETVAVGTVLARIATDALAGDPHPDEHLDERPAGEAAQTPEQHDPAADEPAAREAAAHEPAVHEPAPTAGHERAPAPGQEPATAGPYTPGQETAHTPGQSTHARAQPPSANGERRVYSPVVQRIAATEGVDLSQVSGTGRGGRVSKKDVLAFIEHDRSQPTSAAAEAAAEEAHRAVGPDEPPLHSESPYVESAAPSGRAEGDGPERLSRMRRSIGEHMVRSLQTAAHCTSIIEADFSGVEAARRTLGVTHLPFVARAAIDALRAHPELNATLEGEQLTLHRAVNLGIAISLGADGLIVPVIRDAHELAAEGLARRISELAARARASELTPDEVRGGTFTITNPGGFGTLASTPIINQPQVAILDLEAVVKRPVVVSDEAGRDSIAIRPMAYLCLSWDHRALDGALAAQFLSNLRAHIEAWR